MCAITKFLKACVTNGAIPRHPTEEMLKEGQGDEVVINGGMTVDKNGDVTIGRNLEVDGTLTVGGEPITPGGGGTKLYKHSIDLYPSDAEIPGMTFEFISTSGDEITMPTGQTVVHYYGLNYFLEYDHSNHRLSEYKIYYLSDAFYLGYDGDEYYFGVGNDNGILRGFGLYYDTAVGAIDIVTTTTKIYIDSFEDTVTEL